VEESIVTKAEQIVRALAAADPIHVDLRYTTACALCDAAGRFESEASHKPDCPWRLAVEWVAVAGAVAPVAENLR
jgi:hypothetical protein